VVLPIILVVLVIIAVAVMYWYITLPIIIAIILLWKYSTRNSNKNEESEQSRRSQSSSYQSYSQSDYSSYNSDYNSDYNSSSNDYYKKNTQDHSYQKSKSKSKRKSRSKSKASQAKAKRVNDRLEKYKITPEEAKIIFGRTWRAKLGKQEWEFYYTVRYIEIDVEFDYNNRARKKFGELYSKVLQIIQIVMEENADMREEEGKQRNKYSGYSYDDDFKWNYDDYDYKNYHGDDTDIDDRDIAKAFDTFGLTRESTKEQIKTEYRKLTLKFHPDKNKSKDSTVKMTEINKAYEIILGVIP
jgi:hypothetical protein